MMKQTMSDKLELIARCLRDGVGIQWREVRGGGWFLENCFENEVHVMGPEYEYRAKPVKPLVGEFCTGFVDANGMPVKESAVQLTPEVRAAVIDAGIEIE
jgi:hypothetical protein